MVVDKKRLPTNSLAAAAVGGGMMSEGGLPSAGSYEAQIYQDAWGQGENEGDSGEEDALAKVDRALAMEVNIPLDHKGELVSFREVRMWKLPTQPDLTKLKNRINDEWIKPLNLKQQDIVKASGLGAPYVCYLLKDPNSPNMNRRRKIEAYSVLTELFRKFDAKQVTKQDFIRLRDQRVANRFQGPRQDRSGRGNNVGRPQQRRRRRRPDEFEGEGEEDDGSEPDDPTDPHSRMRRKRPKLYNGMEGPVGKDGAGAVMDPFYLQQMMQSGTLPYYQDPAMFAASGMKMYPYPAMMPMAMPPYGGGMPYPPMGLANYVPVGPSWPHPDWSPNVSRGRYQTHDGNMSEADGTPFQAPYPPGFPPVIRTVTSITNPPPAATDHQLIDGPPSAVLQPDKSVPTAKLEPNTGETKGHDNWVRDKLSALAKRVIVPKSSQGQAPVFREPTTDAFVFLIERDSCLLPIGVKVAPGPARDIANLWDIKALRKDAEEADWLDENRDWDDCLWVLWDIKETGTAVQALFDKWRQDHKLSGDDVNKVAWCFLSQYTYLRDIELSFQALLPHATPDENFCRNVEINCDLLEERIRVKDAFVWDIRSTDWDLMALLSNFVADFMLDSPAISSLFIDLKTTILRYRKEWVNGMLERLTAERKIDPAKVLPGTLGFEQH